ncbi:MAG: Fic/DOC family N-terminal domain-containing protein [Acidimicrobiales bacterium]
MFIPLPIVGLQVSLPGSVAASVSEAEAVIHELNAGSHPALAPLARLLLRTESIASSKVEGLQVDARALARAEMSSELGPQVAPTALEVLGNIDAMQLAIQNATAEESVGVPCRARPGTPECTTPARRPQPAKVEHAPSLVWMLRVNTMARSSAASAGAGCSSRPARPSPKVCHRRLAKARRAPGRRSRRPLAPSPVPLRPRA